MILLEVKQGTAGLVTSHLDDSGWADVAGTMAHRRQGPHLTEEAQRQAYVLSRIPYAGAKE